VPANDEQNDYTDDAIAVHDDDGGNPGVDAPEIGGANTENEEETGAGAEFDVPADDDDFQRSANEHTVDNQENADWGRGDDTVDAAEEDASQRSAQEDEASQRSADEDDASQRSVDEPAHDNIGIKLSMMTMQTRYHLRLVE
jgi:hypothetical protein